MDSPGRPLPSTPPDFLEMEPTCRFGMAVVHDVQFLQTLELERPAFPLHEMFVWIVDSRSQNGSEGHFSKIISTSAERHRHDRPLLCEPSHAAKLFPDECLDAVQVPVGPYCSLWWRSLRRGGLFFLTGCNGESMPAFLECQGQLRERFHGGFMIRKPSDPTASSATQSETTEMLPAPSHPSSLEIVVLGHPAKTMLTSRALRGIPHRVHWNFDCELPEDYFRMRKYDEPINELPAYRCYVGHQAAAALAESSCVLVLEDDIVPQSARWRERVERMLPLLSIFDCVALNSTFNGDDVSRSFSYGGERFVTLRPTVRNLKWGICSTNAYLLGRAGIERLNRFRFEGLPVDLVVSNHLVTCHVVDRIFETDRRFGSLIEGWQGVQTDLSLDKFLNEAPGRFYQCAFAVVCDSKYFPGLMALLNSIHAYHGREVRVFVFTFELSDEQTEQLLYHPLGFAMTLVTEERFTSQVPGTWEAKQKVFDWLCGSAGTVCLLDADLVLLSNLDDVFRLGNEGWIVTSIDGNDQIEMGQEYDRYSPRLVHTKYPNFNSGFLCMNLTRHWDVVALWSFTSRFAEYSPNGGRPLRFPGHGDQGLLVGVVATLGKRDNLRLFPQEEWCNSGGWSSSTTVSIETRQTDEELIVRNDQTGNRQRLIHSTGPKWWRDEGRKYFGKCGDVLKCFEFFERQYPVTKENTRIGVGNSTRSVAGDAGTRQDRSATPLFWLHEQNFGDCLNQWILPSLGVLVEYRPAVQARIVGIGSILNLVPDSFSGQILGPGFMWETNTSRFPHAEITLVRGRLTGERCDAPPSVRFGDPGLLAGRLDNSPVEMRYTLGIVPHYIDLDSTFVVDLLERYPHEICLIDVRRPVPEVLAKIKQCEHILSSSLHGLIAADAFLIPNLWMVLGNKVLGDGFKFRDYFSSFDGATSQRQGAPPMPGVSLSELRSRMYHPGQEVSDKIKELTELFEDVVSHLI